MRARRVLILLIIIAISALTMFLISLLESEAAAATLPLPASPDTLQYYGETIVVGPDGHATVIHVAVIDQGSPGDLLLPFGFPSGTTFTILSGPVSFAADSSGVPQPTTTVLGHRALNLRLRPGAAPGDTVRVSAELPGWLDPAKARRPLGEQALGRRFVNVSTHVIRDFRLELVLPEGQQVHAVTKVDPPHDPKQNPEPPYSLGRRGDRVLAELRAHNLAPASAVELRIHMRPARRGLLPLIGGLIAAVLYLIFFRDVLKPQTKD